MYTAIGAELDALKEKKRELEPTVNYIRETRLMASLPLYLLNDYLVRTGKTREDLPKFRYLLPASIAEAGFLGSMAAVYITTGSFSIFDYILTLVPSVALLIAGYKLEEKRLAKEEIGFTYESLEYFSKNGLLGKEVADFCGEIKRLI
jgi:hypothetical protein